MNIDFENSKIPCPFTTPDGFHEELRTRLMSIPAGYAKKRYFRLLGKIAAMTAAVSALIISLTVMFLKDPPSQPSSIDSYLTSLSDTELDMQLGLTENDIFLDL